MLFRSVVEQIEMGKRAGGERVQVDGCRDAGWQEFGRYRVYCTAVRLFMRCNFSGKVIRTEEGPELGCVELRCCEHLPLLQGREVFQARFKRLLLFQSSAFRVNPSKDDVQLSATGRRPCRTARSSRAPRPRALNLDVQLWEEVYRVV
mgnify:FL=1